MPQPAFGVFDLETTGVDPATDRIVSAYVGLIDVTGAVINGREWLVTPDGYVIPDGAAAVHGITTEHATAYGRPMTEVLPEIVGALASLGRPIVAHNAPYDFTMLVHEMDRVGLPDPVAFVDGIDVLDTFVLDKHLDTYRRGPRTLTSLAAVYGVELTDDEAHGAAADAIAAGRIALVLTADRRLAGIPGPVLRRKQKAWSREQRTSFIAYRRANGDPDFTTDKNWPLYLSALALTVPEPTFVF